MLPYYQTVGSVLHDIIVGWCYYITFLWLRLSKVEQDMKTTIDQVNNRGRGWLGFSITGRLVIGLLQ